MNSTPTIHRNLYRVLSTVCLMTVLTVLVSAADEPRRKWREADYQRVWARANGGEVEVRLDDGTRVDILTDTHAIEVDYAAKWAEAIGQCLYYAARTGRTPAILLIADTANDKWLAYLERIGTVSRYIKIDIPVWVIEKRPSPPAPTVPEPTEARPSENAELPTREKLIPKRPE